MLIAFIAGSIHMIYSHNKTSSTSLTGLIRAIRDCCQRREEEMCKQLDLTSSQFACLIAVPRQPGELAIQDIATALGLSHSRTSRIVDSMVRDGLLNRHTMASDRRTQLVSMTPRGKKKWQAVQKLQEECEKKLREHLNVHRPQKLEGALKALADAW
jgi:DNA-binding MarR family transcriptional regulator